jgi:hypothetical protein
MAKRPLEIRYKGKLLRTGEIGEAIKQLPAKIRGKALEPVAKYYLKQFRKYPRYKRVRRSTAYGSTGATFKNGNPVPDGYFSAKQFHYVMANIADGTFTPGRSQRTNALKDGWHIEGTLTPLNIVNDAPGAVFAYSPIYQARQLDMVGWKDVNEMIADNDEGAFDELIKWMNKNLILELDKIILK